MKTTDPLKRRAEFRAVSTTMTDTALAVDGSTPDDTVLLALEGDRITVAAPVLHSPLLVRKIQLLGRPSWLTLDFEDNSELSRIVIDIESLDYRLLQTCLAAMTKDTLAPFFSRTQNEK